ncbi:hypothetical protein M378DRAFT_12157 [Amanita muscaria Koide BX008]|uniref:Uncharacterized protein n=1 Tax=Amanita muscaria (strain Koide BX008) TaxID=946122 RepID=A0A0C2WP50_AMAMK|nr:hypothetical protein M378DRAFT_12157 [Amanita muscaria Koide BX008]
MYANGTTFGCNKCQRTHGTSHTESGTRTTFLATHSTTDSPTLLQRLSYTQPEPSTEEVTYAELLQREVLSTTLGRIFNQSFETIGDGTRFQAAVQVRTGEEPEQFLDTEDSLSTSVGRMLNCAALNVVNQPVGVSLSTFADDDCVTPGQVVLLKMERMLFVGLTSVYEGPYIFVAQRRSLCALINEDGRFHPVLVPLTALHPYQSSWHLYALPSTVSQHPALQELLASAEVPQHGASN